MELAPEIKTAERSSGAAVASDRRTGHVNGAHRIRILPGAIAALGIDGLGGRDGSRSKKPSTLNWGFAAAYNITAIVGLGVLALPNAMVFLSWGGVPVLVLACLMTYFTLKQLVELHEVDFGKRYRTYHSLGQRAFGENWGLWIILPLQMVVEVSLDILFTIAAGEAMTRMLANCRGGTNQQHLFIWIAVFGILQVGLSTVLAKYEDMRWIAVVAAFSSLCYSTIAWISLMFGGSETPHARGFYKPPFAMQGPNLGDDLQQMILSDTDHVFQAFNAIGVIAFAYAAHNVVLDIQSGLPSPSREAMMKATNFTYLIVLLCYFPMGIAVFSMYGNTIGHNVLSFMMDHVSPSWVVITNVLLIVHLLGSYQIFAIPVFTLLEMTVFQNYNKYVFRCAYIGSTTVIAMIFPFFSPLLGFFGGFAIAPTTFILPCVIWLRIHPSKHGWTIAHVINWVCIVLGILLMIIAIIGGVGALVKQLAIHSFYNLYTEKWKDSGFYPNCTT